MADGRGSAGVGQRVRALRKLDGRTQQQLADRAHVSVSLLRAVEQGRMPASPSFVATVSRALGLSVNDLYAESTPRFGPGRVATAALETAVMAGYAPPAVLDPPIPLTVLAAGVDEVAELHRRGQYDRSAERLPALLDDLRSLVAADPTETAAGLLSRAWGCASIALHRLGSPLAEQAQERAATTARQSGDPLLCAAADLEVGARLNARGAYGPADRLVAVARTGLDDLPATVDSLSVRGHSHLVATITAARAGDPEAVTAHLAAATECAAHVPDGADRYDTAFSPTNVTMHAVAAAVEMNDGTTALVRNAPLGDVMPSRRAHHFVDLGRAYLLHGDRDRALASLHTARAAAPLLTRHHPGVAETVRVLAETDRRRSDTLAGFARWAGVTL